MMGIGLGFHWDIVLDAVFQGFSNLGWPTVYGSIHNPMDVFVPVGNDVMPLFPNWLTKCYVPKESWASPAECYLQSLRASSRGFPKASDFFMFCFLRSYGGYGSSGPFPSISKIAIHGHRPCIMRLNRSRLLGQRTSMISVTESQPRARMWAAWRLCFRPLTGPRT